MKGIAIPCIALVSVSLAACMNHLTFNKPGITVEQQRAGELSCGAAETSLGLRTIEESKLNSYEICMSGKGYTKSQTANTASSELGGAIGTMLGNSIVEGITAGLTGRPPQVDHTFLRAASVSIFSCGDVNRSCYDLVATMSSPLIADRLNAERHSQHGL